MTTDFDPASVPVRPAATVMLIDDRPDLQVLMMERHANTVFAGGMWVFPGGAVDHQDDARYFDGIVTHRDDQQASQLMGLEEGGLAYYMAAVRETFEEAGVLLALHQDETPLSITSDNESRFDTWRDRLNAAEVDLKDILRSEALLADVGQMHYVARWITPLGSPRRFDARFFVARIPSEQVPLHDDGELVNSDWFSPREILERADSGDMVLMTPTLRMIRNLALFDSADQVIQSVSASPSDQQVRVHRDSRELIMPGEPGYDDGLTDVESGWVRLRPVPD